MVEVDDAGLTWVKSSASGDANGSNDCVEVATGAACVLVRSSLHRRGPRLVHSTKAWDALVGWLVAGD
jgi:hypothetical protein